MYDDFTALTPFERKALHLPTTNRPANGRAAARAAREAAASVVSSICGAWKSLASSLRRCLATRPLRNWRTNSWAVGGQCPYRPNANGGSDHDYLLLCIPFMQYAVKVQQADVCRLRSDQDFFRLLALYYDGLRGRTRSLLTLKELKGLHFVQVCFPCTRSLMLSA